VASQGPAAVAPAAQAYTAVTVADSGGVHPVMTALWFAFLFLWVVATGVTTGWTYFSGLFIGGILWLARYYTYFGNFNILPGTALLGVALLVSFLLFDYVWVALAKRLK